MRTNLRKQTEASSPLQLARDVTKPTTVCPSVSRAGLAATPQLVSEGRETHAQLRYLRQAVAHWQLPWRE
jgi:hypothetical protein